MPPSQPAPEREKSSAFAHLGMGGAEDRLGFQLVVQILWRAVPLMRPVRGHLLALGGSLMVMVVLGLPVMLLMTDILSTRVLEGRVLTQIEARVLALDPISYATEEPDKPLTGPGAVASELPMLGAEQRRNVRDRWLIAAFVMTLLGLPLGAGLIYYGLWILQRINQVLRVALLERIQTLSLRFHAESRVGDSVYRLFQDSAMVTNVIETLFLRPLQFGFMHLLGFAVAFALDPLLGLTLLLVWPAMLGLGSWFSGRLRAGFRAARETNSNVTSRIQETLAGIRVIKAYGAEGFEQERFERDSRDAFEAAFGARNLYMLFGVSTFWVAGSALIAGIVRAALQTHAGADVFAQGVLGFLGFTAWNYGLFTFGRQRLGQGTSSVEQMMSWWGRAQDVAIGLDRVYELLDLEPEVQDRPDAVPLRSVERSIVFRDVSFSYQPGQPVLEKVAFEARPGTITAIVGPTGSGKSTLMSLLLRLFDPDEGRIEIDGRDLRDLQLASLRASIAIALQENILFKATVRENIRYAVPDANDAQVREAARVAAADRFVEDLHDGYDTMLGERGTKLSTGQRQRLSIARAVLKDTPILVLDEPTAALDAETELRVLQNLSEWGRGRAIFLVTHRLSTIRRADQILYLRGGRLVEAGSHEELTARRDGAFRRFVELEEPPGTAPALAGGG